MQSYGKPRKNDSFLQYDFKTLFTGSLPEDKPFLEEMGIDFGAIKRESTLVFNKTKIYEDENNTGTFDLVGPLFLISAYAIALTLRGKLHFGYIYMLCMFFSIGIFSLLNLLADEYAGLTTCCNIIGYSFLPICLFAWSNAFLFLLPKKFKLMLGVLADVWSSFVGSKVLCRRLNIQNKTFVVGYAMFLGYFTYVLMVVF